MVPFFFIPIHEQIQEGVLSNLSPTEAEVKKDLSGSPRRSRFILQEKDRRRKSPSAPSLRLVLLSGAATPPPLSSGVASPPWCVSRRLAGAPPPPPIFCRLAAAVGAVSKLSRLGFIGYTRKNPHSRRRLLCPAARLLFLSAASCSSSTQKDSTDCRDALPPCSFSPIPFHQIG